VHLEERVRQDLALDERRAADASALLVPEDDYGSLSDTLDRFDPRHDAERPVELPAVRDRVEMRAGPDASGAGATDEISRRVDLDLETRLLQPLSRELVSVVFTLRPPDAIRSDAAGDGVELVESLQHAHAAIIPSGRDTADHVRVSDTVTEV
jgi:hypothetical protein